MNNGELLDYYVERYNADDLDAVMDLYAEDAVQIMPEAPSRAGARSVSASRATWSRARISHGPC